MQGYYSFNVAKVYIILCDAVYKFQISKKLLNPIDISRNKWTIIHSHCYVKIHVRRALRNYTYKEIRWNLPIETLLDDLIKYLKNNLI